MADNQFSVAVPNILQALMQGQEGFKEARGYQDDRARSQARQDASAALQSGDPNAGRNALAMLLGAGDTQGANVLAQYQNSANGVYGTPIYGVDEKGVPGLGAMDKTGGFRRLDTGGFTVQNPVKTIDTGTGTLIIDSRTGQPVGGRGASPQSGGQQPAPQAMPGQPQTPVPQGGYVPKDVLGEARDKKTGTEIGDRQAEFGKAQAALDSSIGSLDRLAAVANRIKNDPALDRITGVMGKLWNYPGGQAANVQAQLDVLKSQVSFGVLQAMREASKTGGALGSVSDAEGRRLENNLAALDQAQDVKSFKRAMDDIVRYVNDTKPRLTSAFQQDYARIRPQGAPQGGQQGGAPANSGALQQAKDAIERGADRNAVIQRLRQNGIDPAGL
jgi:hypothetical protein